MDTSAEGIAIVGVGAILPDAPTAPAFWRNVTEGRYSVTEVPPERWDPDLYYDPDPKAPDKTYSKIGGWVGAGQWEWDPLGWKLPIPPRVSEAMDDGQKWAVACTREALADFGYPARPLDGERTAVILGNAMGGEKHYLTVLRIMSPEFVEELTAAPSFMALPNDVQAAIATELRTGLGKRYPEVTEDTMPGELSNILAGRVANLFNFRGPNFTTDAACASGLAAMTAAVQGLRARDYDAVITGGIDRNMGIGAFVKFCKIGALSATGTRPYAEGADGFVMGEGAAVFLLKRLSDAERDDDRVYAVLLSLAGSSDGKGKGITAPNPIGQRLAVERAWTAAGLAPQTASLVEGHGTSTAVGDVVEVESLQAVFGGSEVPAGSIALGSVKSNIGHLKSAAAAAGMLKATLALHEKVLPPSLNFARPNPGIEWERSPFRVNTELRPWERQAGGVRRAGVSAFGFGGTNFHAVLEEHVPGRGNGGRRTFAVPERQVPVEEEVTAAGEPAPAKVAHSSKTPLRGALLIGSATADGIIARLEHVEQEAESGRAPAAGPPAAQDLRAPERLAIDYADAADLATKAEAALKALAADSPVLWKALRGRGIFRGRGAPPKVAFLYTGQGSQYANMLKALRETEPIVAETFAQADIVMTPLLGKPLSDYVFVDGDDPSAMAAAEVDLMQTAITQPAVLATDLSITKLLAAYGIRPDMVMGHSLGEYGALVAAGALTFEHALEAVSARGREMTNITVEDNGKMAAIVAPLPEIERVLAGIDGYVVIANINSNNQAVIGGGSDAVDRAVHAFAEAGFQAIPLPVSHAFHTSIVDPASEPLRQALVRLELRPPELPIVANVSGAFYPMGSDVVPEMLDILAAQVASPVQFVKGLRTLYEAGARVFVEVGPKKALSVFADDVLGGEGDVVSLFTNHPKVGDLASFNQALCGLYAAGFGAPSDEEVHVVSVSPSTTTEPTSRNSVIEDRTHEALDELFGEFLERARGLYDADLPTTQGGGPEPLEVVITGAALGLPGAAKVFDDENVGRILRGEQLIGPIPVELRQAMLAKHVTRLVKRENADPTFETIDDQADVIKLAGRAGEFDLEAEFGVAADRLAALDRGTQLAIGAGIDAIRDAGIPMVPKYRVTTKGTKLPEGWMLPPEVGDETGVIFASAFPGLDSLVDEVTRYQEDRARRAELTDLEAIRTASVEGNGASTQALLELDRLSDDLRRKLEEEPYVFDRRFLFRSLSMGHAQFAELMGARGPNTQVNSACASTTQAVGLAQDWIRAGRCRRVIVIAADDATSDHLMEWIGAGFLASGAAATDEEVEDAATPFDRRRHGMIIGMGAAALVVEPAEEAGARGIRPICQVLATATANSAFHGSRLDVEHIAGVMEELVSDAEARWGIRREEIAPEMVFVSHETYTPARGGSAAAEVEALRRVFGDSTDRIVVANTKGFTGHPMGVGIEDVVAVKALETGLVPPVPNFKEIDPDLGVLNLSRGGSYPIRYALRLAAGFGSQISMTLLRWVPGPDGSRTPLGELGYAGRIDDPATWTSWLAGVTGASDPQLEVVQRRLRLRPGDAPAAAQPEPAEPEVAEPVQPEFAESVREVEPPQADEPASSADSLATSDALCGPVPVLSEDEIRGAVLALVAEVTGYPADMLDFDLDLEADLGIDTVKQAEIFVTLREAYGISRDDTLKLRDFPTLSHVIGFVRDRAGIGVVPQAGGSEPEPPVQADAVPLPAVKEAQPVPFVVPTEEEVRDRVLALVAEKTGHPADMLDPDLDLEADLGIDTVKQAEIFVALREAYSIPRDDTLKLRDFPTLAHVVGFVRDRAGAHREASVPVTDQAPEPDAAATVTEPEPEAAPVPEIAPQSISEELVLSELLALVAEVTGYPADMLDPDLDLEADLGIDTVKQAEIFVALRETYSIPRDDTLKLRDFPTLAHVVGFVMHRATAGGSSEDEAVPAVTETIEASAEPVPGRVVEGLEAADAVPRRVPIPVLRPSLDVCRATGVVLGEGSRVIVMADAGGVAKELAVRLEERGAECLLVDDAPSADNLVARVREWAGRTPVAGVYWLPALDRAEDVWRLEPDEWREALRVRVKLLFAAMRELVAEAATPPFLVTATRLGGLHGYGDEGASDVLGGAVTGFAKAYKREQPAALVKAIDVEREATGGEVAATLVEETLRDPGAVEIGHRAGLRWSVGLEERPAGAPGTTTPLGPDTVFAVTGAAGSIVSAIVSDLAGATGATFHLLDLAPEPDPADPDLVRFSSDRDGLKRELFDRIRARGDRATPAMVERELAKLERARAALAAIDAIRAAGGTARYHRVDLTDPIAVHQAIDAIRTESGRVDVLVHAAGLEVSHSLADKEPREFDLVFDVKVDGLFNVLHALGDDVPDAVVVFSSVAGRFGNAGQTDYSAANDLLCKAMSNLRHVHRRARGVAIDWTAWAGIGMASRGSIPKMMELAGIDMLPPEAGIPVTRRELLGGTNGEVIVGGRLGVLLEEFDELGGIDPGLVQVPSAMVGTVASMGVHDGLVVQTELDPTGTPFLDHHRIEGTAVLPGVMGIEAFAEAARLPLPGWHVTAVEDVEFLAPFKFYRDEPRTISVHAVFTPDGDDLVARCRLIGIRHLPGQEEPQTTVHFTGRVRLARSPTDLGAATPPSMPAGIGIGADDLYRVYFHGPAYRVLERAWPTAAGATGRMAHPLPEDLPGGGPLMVAPRLIELCFQTAGAWEIAAEGRFGLPWKVARIRVAEGAAPGQGRFAVVSAGAAPDAVDAVVLTEGGQVLARMEGYRTVELPGALAPEAAAPFRAALG